MKTFYSFITLMIISIIIFGSSAQAQLTGIKTIKTSGGDYATFTAAITALNTSGVGTGGVIFNVSAGFTVTELCPIITATGTSANPIVFQKSGAGANPVITAGTGTSTTVDGIIRISGGDYITFDGIDVAENSANTTPTTRMEFGYYIYNASATNGARYNTIKNCKITLNRLNTTTRALYQIVTTTPTSAAGQNSYNKYQNVVVENSYQGIYITGHATYPSLETEISNCTIGASIANDIGNGANTTNGIRMTSVRDANIFGNEVRNVTVTGAVVPYGIYLELLQGTCNIYNNKVHDINSTSTSTSSIIYGIRADINSTYTCNIYNNFVYELSHGSTSATATIVIRGITVAMTGTGTGNIYYNSVRIGEDAFPSSAAMYVGTTVSNINIKNNIFTNFSTAGATSFRYCIYKGTGSILNNIDNNDYYINTSGTNNNIGSYDGTDRNTLANWRASTSQDVYSISVNPPFTSASDLHISTGTATLLESGGTAINTPAITTDIDGLARNASTPDIGADEGSFTAASKTINWYTINQASTSVVYPNTANQEILRIDVCVVGSAGTLPLNSIVVNSANISDADVSSVKLYRTSTPTFSTANQLGSAITFSGGTATFSSLSYDFPTVSTTYIWIAYDVASGAVMGNTLDAKVLANQINISGNTFPSSDADPVGSRMIVSAMTGIYTIPGDYATLTLAVDDLNLRGIAGDVTFNVAAGFTENTSTSILITATGTSSNTITFQKDPSTSGANPLITRSDPGSKTTTNAGGDGDAIIQINGSDYMIFDGIDVSSNDAGIEYGYYTYKPSGTDGCQNVTIKNCVITMIKSTISNVVIGIYISNGPTTLSITISSNTGVVVTDISGRNENIEVSNNLIQNVNGGIYALGYKHTTSPYDFYDQNITIGKAGAGNTIQNFGFTGGGTITSIYSAYSNNFNASYNNINNTAGGGTASTSYFYAIFSGYTLNATITFSYNILSLTSSVANATNGIYNNAGDANSTLNVHHNIVENCVHGSSGTFSAFNNAVAGITLNLYSNKIRNNTINSGSSYMFNLGSVGTANVYNNIIENTTIAGGTSTSYAISSAGTVVNVYGNSISGYSSTAAARVYAISITGGTAVNVYNNLIYDLNSAYTDATTDAIRGISISSTTASSTIGIYNNSIYLNASSGGADFWTSCIYHTYNATATTAALDMRNNILVNTSTPNGAGKSIAFRRSASTDLNNYSTLSNNNLFYSGSPGASNLIFYDGTNSYQTLADFKAAVGATRESYSVSGDPGFTSSTNLIPDPTNHNSWILSGNGIHIAGITTDFAGTTRPTVISEGAPDIGAYEFTAGSTTPNSFVIVPVSGSNDVYVNGRKLINLYFSNLGGISSIDVQFYSGVVPPGTSGYPVMNGYFIVTQTGGSGFVYDLTYYYSESQIGTIANESLIRLSKSDNGGTNWNAYTVLGTGQEQYLLDNTANTVKVHQLNSFSIFTNGDGNAPLPVQLSSLSSLLNGRDVKLLWKTDKETNNAGFDVERKTEGSNLWCTVGFVKGNGSSNTPANYSFLDKKLNSGKYNYRLKQIDYNGNFEYHNLTTIVDVSLPTKFNLSQNYPNPFNPTTKIDFDLPFDSKVSIILYDITGREVKTLVNDTRTAGFHTVQFNASGLSSGTYFYRIMTKSNSGDYVITKKMVLVK